MKGNNEENKRIANNIRCIRELRGISRHDTARMMGVATVTYTTWELARAELPLSTLNKMAEIFKIGIGISIVQFNVDDMIDKYFKEKS